ncbi:MAG: fructan hydrolase [Desulfobacterales bacterium]
MSAWVAVDKDLSEWIYTGEPRRRASNYYSSLHVRLPKGSIEKLIGRKLKWEDEPVELSEDGEKT